MKYDFKQSGCARQNGFTLVEIAAAMVLLAMMIGTVLVVMSNGVEATMDMRSRGRAFQIAREKLEDLLTAAKVSDMTEYGFSELYPEIQWEIRVEPFYEPISDRMWVRGVSTATYTDSKGEVQTVELEHWLNGLTAAQIKQIQDAQKKEEEILEALYGEEDTQLQDMTKFCLEKMGRDVKVYEGLLRRQREEKIEYLLKYGMNDGYETLLEEMETEEWDLLATMNVNYVELDECLTMVSENPELLEYDPDKKPDDEIDPTKPEIEPVESKEDCPDCATLSAEVKLTVCQMMGCCCE